MTSSMNSFKCAPNYSGILTPSEEEVKINIDYFHLLFNYLKLLGFDTKCMQNRYHIKFDSETFKVPNQKAFQFLSHFLFTKLDSRKSAETFRDTWPITDKKQEASFRNKVKNWFEQLKKDDVEIFQNQHINPTMFMGPCGEKFVRLMCMLCAHIMSKIVPEPLGSIPMFVNKNATVKESKLPQHFQYQLMKESLLIFSEEQSQIIQSFGHRYEECCLLSKQLVKRHRFVCQQELSENSNLSSIVKQNQMTESQKKSLFDINNNSTKMDMLAEVQIKKNCLDELMNDYLLTLENRFDSSWKVIERVLAMKKNRLIIDGHKLVHQLPSEFIDSYQTAHSGTRMELQLRDGRYDFLPVLNLLLYAVTMASQLSSTLHFPPLDDELEKLNQMKESTNAREGVAVKLQQRWNDIALNQTKEIEQLLQKRVELNSTMLLQSLTPLRSLMSPMPSEGVEDIQTPLALRAALGMTPLVENGARLKTHSTASRRPSVDPLQRCKEGHRFNGHNGLEKADSNKIKDKRRSQEATNGHAIRTEVIRTNSLTPDLTTKPSTGKTQAGASLYPRLSTGRPSSLAASPVFERLMQSEVPVRQPKPKPQRRSLPQAHPSTSSPFRSQSRSAAVLDHAADAIVNDLVVLDSPVAPSTKIIDPNSSFEMSAFVSRNRILRSPDQLEFVSNGGSSNMDLLRLLEVKLASPARRSSLPAGFLTPTAAASSRPSSLVNSPIIGADWTNEKGLLDASSASLIDDYLDF